MKQILLFAALLFLSTCNPGAVTFKHGLTVIKDEKPGDFAACESF